MDSVRLSSADSRFLAHLRSISIVMIVLGHVGLGWIYKPWSEFISVFVSLFFFISGAVSYHSYLRANTLGSYYKKRFLGLYIPYLLLCVICLAVYFFQHHRLPDCDIERLLAWIEIHPTHSSMPFEVGQVWFIHTLLIISFLSPVYFIIIMKKKLSLVLVLFFTLLILPTLQIFYDIDNYFIIYGNNFYKPLVHSIFFIVGAWCFSGNLRYTDKLYWFALLSVFMLVISMVMVKLFNLQIGYGYHTYAPDIYYLTGSFSAIFILLSLKKAILYFADFSVLLTGILKILFIYTMPIFLLHSFSIYISETIFGLIHPDKGFIVYGLIKFSLVMVMTLLISYPFCVISTKIKSFLI